MIRKSISDSDKFARLSPKAATLYQMMIAHYNAHGKMHGGAGFVKEVVCPKIKFLTTRNIPHFLVEISRHTNVKYFKHGGRWWLHSIKFNSKHQKLRPDRLGDDNLPSYPRVVRDKSGQVLYNPGVCPPEVEGKDEEEVIVKGNGTTPNPMRGELRSLLSKATKPMPRPSREILAELKAHKGKNGE